MPVSTLGESVIKIEFLKVQYSTLFRRIVYGDT